MSWPSVVSRIQKKPVFYAWLTFALYSVGISVLVQFLVLPILAPGIHAGHGILAGKIGRAHV